MAGKPSSVQELPLSDLIRNISPNPDDHDEPMSVETRHDAIQFQESAVLPPPLDVQEDDEMDSLDFQEAELLRTGIGDIKDAHLAKLVRRYKLVVCWTMLSDR